MIYINGNRYQLNAGRIVRAGNDNQTVGEVAARFHELFPVDVRP